MNKKKQKKVLMLASVASMIDQFNMPNIRLMLEMGYEVHILCNFLEGNTCDKRRIKKIQKILQDMQVVWHQWDCPRNAFSVPKCCAAYWQLWALTGKYQFAWIHCHSPVGGVLARIAAHHRKIKVVYTAHGFHFYRGAPLKNWLLYYPAEAWLAHWTDVLVTVNGEDWQFAKRHLKAGKIYRIPGVGIDVEKFEIPEEGKKEFCIKYGIPENAQLLLSVGELNKGKNHRMVIRALSKIEKQEVHYLICGQGRGKKSLQRYAARMQVDDRLHMLGYQENMQQIYEYADVFVFPSRREGMPVALMEAMAAGLPCAVSDIRGNRELIDDARGGIRFSPKKLQQLVDALDLLLGDDPFRRECKEYNKKKIRAYEQAAVDQKMQKIYSQLCLTGAKRVP